MRGQIKDELIHRGDNDKEPKFFPLNDKMHIRSFSSNDQSPSPILKYYNLAVVKQQTIMRGQIKDEFIRKTIHGDIDDILKEKELIEVEQIFSLDDKVHKVILIEGPPGSGKSTLLWYICCKWQARELF